MATTNMQSLAIVCADVGSVAKGNFGWWSTEGQVGHRPSELVAHVAALLNSSIPVALGFECPLFVPLADDEMALTSARPGEGSRPWSAGAGCGALTTGLVQVTWTLQRIRDSLRRSPSAYLSWSRFATTADGLFLWEAFVSGAAKSDQHVHDAQAGAEAFRDALPDPPAANAITCYGPVHSLIGAALLRTGWTDDIAVLLEPCMVLRASAGPSCRPDA